MKFNLKFLSLALASIAMVSCSEDKLSNPEDSPVVNGSSGNSGKTVYITTGLTLPNGKFSRSGTEDPDDIAGTGNDQTNSDANPDFEYGHTYENEVNNVILVFTNKANKYISHSVIPAINQSPAQGQKFDFQLTASISYDALETAYEKGDLGGASDTIVHVYAFCNYTSRMYERFQDLGLTKSDDAKRTQWINWEGIVEEDPSPAWEKPSVINTIWSKNSFTMTNAEVKDLKFPSSMAVWDNHTDQNNPYKVNDSGDQDQALTPIVVERVAARIDFKDGSPDPEAKPNTYPIKVYTKLPTTNADGSTNNDGVLKNFYSIKLTRMSLVNMNKNYYYLRRVSNDGTNNNSTVGGTETSVNYVVDYNWQAKSEYTIDVTNADKVFNFPLYEVTNDTADVRYARSQWYSNDIVDILSNDAEGDTWGTTSNYKIWRYVTENTIPSAEQQTSIMTTGIVFKGSIIPGDDMNESTVSQTVKTALEKAKENNQGDMPEELVNLYDYQNILYGSVQEIIDSALVSGANSPLYNKIYRILRHWKLQDDEKTYIYDEDELDGLTVEAAHEILDPNGDKKDEFDIDFSVQNKTSLSDEVPYKNDKDGQFMALCAQNDITVFIASNEQDTDGWGYYCYYIYWNRHNDNAKSSKMGTMEFATVRNNVYKLSVTNIGKFGHPRNTEFDPDPVDPDDPDEDASAYISVKVEVLPWVVRENNITF
ncbi:MAG: Mfa1 fimbrilin C-terminal domain-containing protein [Muribaculaceae bacterium]|nr:Mfa1 fimbrilin C-terminal domain-containing protein [Muribaculaceae bacterium]